MFNTYWTVEVPKVVRQKMFEIWKNLGQTYVTNVGSECPVCLEFMQVGERHLNCRIHTNPEYSCIVCGRDERYGNHRRCATRIRELRSEVIEIFRNSSK